jgi:diguanylate cyclase (GGDEF)-like protein
MGDLGTASKEGRADESAHRPFRAWALQQDMLTLLGGGTEWQSDGEQPDLDDPEASQSRETIRGQGYLRDALKPDPRFALRTRTSLVLWTAALLTYALNQLSPIAIATPIDSFWVTTSLLTFAIAFTALVFPGLAPSRFVVVEQAMLFLACAVILYQSSATGGGASPYVNWFVLTSFYVSYLLPTIQAVANLTLYSSLVLGSLLLDEQTISNSVFLQLAALVLTIWVVGLALIRQRRQEQTVERATAFLALADPLTSTANVRSFERYLDEIQRGDSRRFAVVLADMNGLKAANAVFGHEIGDGMVVRTGRLMLSASGERDQVARFGGDEFAVVIPNAGAAEVTKWREQFEALTRDHNAAVRGRLPQISVALGSALYPDDAIRTDQLIDLADRRMYADKEISVAPPYEIEGIGAADASRSYRSAGLNDPPRHVFDTPDRMRTGAINWLAGGLLALAVAIVGGTYVHRPAAFVAAALALVFAGICEWQRSRPMTRSMAMIIEFSTLAYPLPAIWATGGSGSPLLITVMMPVALYSQTFPRRIALPRVIILMLGFVGGFLSTGAHSESELALFATATTAIIACAWIMQYSERQQRKALGLIRSSARVDLLTELPNTFALRTDLAEMVKAQEQADAPAPFGLIVIDLDDFRRANTLAGHSGGDELLRRTARRLRETAPENSVYRIDGDEFVVLAHGLSAGALDELARSCCRAVAFDLRLGETVLGVTASHGSASWTPEADGDDLIDSAESMLQGHKTQRDDDRPTGGPVLL